MFALIVFHSFSGPAPPCYPLRSAEMTKFMSWMENGGMGQGALRDFIGLAQCPSRKSTSVEGRHLHMLFCPFISTHIFEY